MSSPIRVVVTGAAGQIGYSLLFRIASGEVFGADKKVHLHLLELPVAVKSAEGVAMELDDCAFPTLAGVDCFDDPEKAFSKVNWALLVGSTPRTKGMERSDLIKANAPIFVQQGRALNRAANDVRIVVVGNPCNTNALIAASNCQEVPVERFSAMTALDENRAVNLLAKQAGVGADAISNMVIWGNHSTTMYPDFEVARINGKKAEDVIKDRNWLEKTFIPRVQNRGAEIIEARGKSSAASAASACIDHVKKMSETTSKNPYSAAIMTKGDHYDIPAGIFCSYPLKNNSGKVEIVKNMELSAFAKERIQASVNELLKERDTVKEFLK